MVEIFIFHAHLIGACAHRLNVSRPYSSYSRKNFMVYQDLNLWSKVFSNYDGNYFQYIHLFISSFSSRATIVQHQITKAGHASTGSVALPAVLRSGESDSGQYSTNSMQKAQFSKMTQLAHSGHVMPTVSTCLGLSDLISTYGWTVNRRADRSMTHQMVSHRDDSSNGESLWKIIIVCIMTRKLNGITFNNAWLCVSFQGQSAQTLGLGNAQRGLLGTISQGILALDDVQSGLQWKADLPSLGTDPVSARLDLFFPNIYICLLRISIPVSTTMFINFSSPWKWWILNTVLNGFFFNTIFVSSHMYPENPEGTQVIVGSKNMGYISDTARNRTHNLFHPKREPIPLGHSDG